MSNSIARFPLLALTAALAGCTADVSLDPTTVLPHSAESAAAFSVEQLTPRGRSSPSFGRRRSVSTTSR